MKEGCSECYPSSFRRRVWGNAVHTFLPNLQEVKATAFTPTFWFMYQGHGNLRTKGYGNLKVDNTNHCQNSFSDHDTCYHIPYIQVLRTRLEHGHDNYILPSHVSLRSYKRNPIKQLMQATTIPTMSPTALPPQPPVEVRIRSMMMSLGFSFLVGCLNYSARTYTLKGWVVCERAHTGTYFTWKQRARPSHNK
eukprot:scaffold20794_cov117-Cylindrotheca_fusiformis.AAC.2